MPKKKFVSSSLLLFWKSILIEIGFSVKNAIALAKNVVLGEGFSIWDVIVSFFYKICDPKILKSPIRMIIGIFEVFGTKKSCRGL